MTLESDEAQDVPRMPLPDCGQRVSVESPRHAEKLWTYMIGFKPGGYLVLEKPYGADPAEGNHPLNDGDSLVIRFLKDGSIYGFRTPVLSTLSFPYKLVFVAYPVDVARHSLRSSPRLQCYLPCEGRIDGRQFSRAFIRDFSATGCQLRIPLEALSEEEAALEPDTPAAEQPGEQASGLARAAETESAELAASETDAASSSAAGVSAALAATAAALEEESAAGAEPDAGALADRLEGSETAVDTGGLALHMQLPGEEGTFFATGEVLEWQELPRYHQLRVKFDEPQNELFELLSLYTTQLG